MYKYLHFVVFARSPSVQGMHRYWKSEIGHIRAGRVPTQGKGQAGMRRESDAFRSVVASTLCTPSELPVERDKFLISLIRR